MDNHLNDTLSNHLKSIYYDPNHPTAYGGVEKLYRAVRKDGKFVLSRNRIEKWLVKQDHYAVHKEEKTKSYEGVWLPHLLIISRM